MKNGTPRYNPTNFGQFGNCSVVHGVKESRDMKGSDSERTLHFTAPGLKSQLIDIAPESEEPLSKRFDVLAEGDDTLDRNQVVLDKGTRARNREFQERLNAVWESTKGYDGLLQIEAREAGESILDIREKYQKAIDVFNRNLQEDIRLVFDKLDNDLYPVQTERLDVVRKGVDVFVNETVPENIEKQSGEVSRSLKKAYEAFNIEQQKERNREVKFVNGCNDLIQETAQKFADEDAMMAANLYTLEEDVVENERRAARMHYRRHDLAVKEIVDVRAVIKTEKDIRGVEDADLLDTVIETQGLIQKTVIDNFGANAESGQPPEPPKFDKLEERMSRRGSRASAVPPGAGDDASIASGAANEGSDEVKAEDA